MGSIALSEANGQPFSTALPSVWETLQLSASRWNDKLALVCLHQKADLYDISPDRNANYLRWTYKDLMTAVERMVRNLTRLGVRPGQSIATFLPNGVEFVILFWAAHKLGSTFVPVNPKTLQNTAETLHMLRTAQAPAVVVPDGLAATKIDDLGDTQLALKVLVGESRPGWLSFAGLLDPKNEDAVLTSSIQSDTVTILFTSGTTPLPKGCRHTNATLHAFMANLSLGGMSENDIFCSVLPNNHAMGYFYCLYFFCHGGAVVFPSSTFDARSMLDALETESCTHACLVPTALRGLLQSLASRSVNPKLSLVDVCLAGASVTPVNMRHIIHELGSQGVSTGFGMTEGSPIWTGYSTDPETLIRGDATLVGTPSHGASIKICAPESRHPLPRDQQGEIHQSGPGLIHGYIGVESESFYIDNGQEWFVTGDQAIMFDDGMISITSRYKDMIIRGGENIAPSSIEIILNRYNGIQVQVVGVPDPIAGELPVVVADSLAETTVKTMQDAILKSMGPTYLPDEVLTLEQLGLQDFPETASGKVQKVQLAAIVREYRLQRENEENTKDDVEETVLPAWQKAIGIASEHLDQDAPTTIFADSIATMRVRDTLKKRLHIVLSPEEMIDHPTIRSQIALVRTRRPEEASRRVIEALTGPPSLEDLILHFGGEEEAVTMKTEISKALREQGFNWEDDVSAVIQSYDALSVLVEAGVIHTWNFAIAVTSKLASVQDFRVAVEKTLANTPVLTSFCAVDQERNTHYITLNATQKLWDLCISDYGTVKTTADVQHLAIRYPSYEHARFPGPLFRCIIVHVEETNSAAIVMYLHHVVHDATLIRNVYEDLDQALLHPLEPLQSHAEFKAWAESYQALRHSPSATLSVNYHTKRLRNLHAHKTAFWPPAIAPRQATQEDPDGMDFGFDAPDLITLKQAHPHVTASTVLKTAMSLIAVQRTGHTHAIFNNFEAGRGDFPFIPASLIARNKAAYESADVCGPTMEIVTNLVEVNRTNSAISLLTQMQDDQANLTKHAHAPLRRVIDALNANGSGSGDLIVEAQRTHFLTWIPGFLGEYKSIQVAQIAIRCVAGLVVVAGLGGPDATTYMISMRWDVANFDRERTAAYLEDLKSTILWLTKRENWDVSVSTLLNAL